MVPVLQRCSWEAASAKVQMRTVYPAEPGSAQWPQILTPARRRGAHSRQERVWRSAERHQRSLRQRRPLCRRRIGEDRRQRFPWAETPHVRTTLRMNATVGEVWTDQRRPAPSKTQSAWRTADRYNAGAAYVMQKSWPDQRPPYRRKSGWIVRTLVQVAWTHDSHHRKRGTTVVSEWRHNGL